MKLKEIISAQNKRKSQISANVINAFISSHLINANQLYSLNAEEWYNRFDILETPPNALTFAMFLDHALKRGALDEAKDWIAKMEAKQITIQQVLLSSHFPDNEAKRPLEAYLRSIDKSVENIVDTDSLFLSVMQDIQDSKR